MDAFVLFVMFFVSPPAAKASPVWTLHSTTQFQFASMRACKKFGEHLQDQLDTTDTMKMRGWCVNVKTGASTYGVPPPSDSGDDVFTEIRSERSRSKRK